MSTNGTDNLDNSSADNFSSPNIKGQDTNPNIETSYEEDVVAAPEKVEIDGIPIAEDEIKFRSENIKKKDDSKLFVNVEGAAKRAREAERKKEQEKLRQEKEHAEKARLAKEKAERHQREMEEQSEAHAKKINQHKQKLKQDIAKQKRREAREKRISNFKAVLNFLFGGKHKYVSLGIIGAIVIAIGVYAINVNVIEPARIAKIQETTEKNYYRGSEEAVDIEAVITKTNDMELSGASADEMLSYIQSEIDSSTTELRKGVLSALYWRTYGYEKDARSAIEKLETIYKESDISFVKAEALDSISLLYGQLKDYDKCQEYLEKAKEYK